MWSFSRVVAVPVILSKNICDMCFEKYQCDIASYADNTTRHKSDLDLNVDFSKKQKTVQIFYSTGLRKITRNQMMISATILSLYQKIS